MIETGRDAKKIVQQITAAKSTLTKVHCVVAANEFSNESNASVTRQHLDELIKQNAQGVLKRE